MPKKIVISASRRTDIPAFYMDRFMADIEKGWFTVENPFNRTPSTVAASPEAVHTIVFWSKNFGPFISGGYGQRLRQRGYHLFFNFTVNSESAVIEPGIIDLDTRLGQAEALCRQFGAETVQWRFDPICFYRTNGGPVENNLDAFADIAQQLGITGIRRCVTSFMDMYAKVQKRTARLDGFEWVDPPMDKKVRILLRMQRVLENHGMSLYTCCENDVMAALPPDAGIAPSACVPNRRLVELFGGKLSFAKDSGQRKQKGCGCMVSRDIGVYRDQPCHHGCLYCYANK